ncbi:MAG: undecaprenyl/decaprenyl-phosphate alpha-N-acetylglucosaminyl 1-phosphate transferase [Planctomycetes bacterium]|nr:undecaprenyl/decaprenyl-phosphate alpha-N-acetylglucosaminyl 1-phosphate transferase [Planctomycetota bacterium]
MFVAVYIYFFLVSCVLALLFIPIVRNFAINKGILDHPSKRKIHDHAIPLLGGLGIFLAFLAILYLHLAFVHIVNWFGIMPEFLPPRASVLLRGIPLVLDKINILVIGGVCIVLIGLFDDIFKLSVRQRLAFETLVAIFIVSMGIRPELYIFPSWLAWTLSVIWLVGISNAFNLIDGMDGLAGGIAFIAAMILALTMATHNQPMVAVLLFTIAGATLGFLKFNFPPANIYLGSCGSLFLGYILATTIMVSTMMTETDGSLVALFMPVMVLGIPLYDTLHVIVSRLMSHRSPFLADTNHIHHRLHRLGFSRRKTVLLILLFCFCIGINATLLIDASPWMRVVLFVQILATFGLFFVIETVRRPAPPAPPVDEESDPHLQP